MVKRGKETYPLSSISERRNGKKSLTSFLDRRKRLKYRAELVTVSKRSGVIP